MGACRHACFGEESIARDEFIITSKLTYILDLIPNRI